MKKKFVQIQELKLANPQTPDLDFQSLFFNANGELCKIDENSVITVIETGFSANQVFISNSGNDTYGKLQDSLHPFKTLEAAVDKFLIDLQPQAEYGSYLENWEFVFLGSTFDSDYDGDNIFNVATKNWQQAGTIVSLKLIIPKGVEVRLLDDTPNVVFNSVSYLSVRGEGKLIRTTTTDTNYIARTLDVDGLEELSNLGGDLNGPYAVKLKNITTIKNKKSIQLTDSDNTIIENIRLIESINESPFRGLETGEFIIRNCEIVSHSYPILFPAATIIYEMTFIDCNLLTTNAANFLIDSENKIKFKFIRCKIESLTTSNLIANYAFKDSAGLHLENSEFLSGDLNNFNFQLRTPNDINDPSIDDIGHIIAINTRMNKGFYNLIDTDLIHQNGFTFPTLPADGTIITLTTTIEDPINRNWTPIEISHVYGSGEDIVTIVLEDLKNQINSHSTNTGNDLLKGCLATIELLGGENTLVITSNDYDNFVKFVSSNITPSTQTTMSKGTINITDKENLNKSIIINKGFNAYQI